MNKEQLRNTANAIVQKGKGILAADESNPTCGKRFDDIGVDSTEKNRNMYRDILFTTNGMEELISGVILFDETLRQSTISDNTPFPQYLSGKGIIPGIKVDKGAKELALRGKDLAYSENQFLRFVDKVGGAFRARGRKPQEVFEAKMKQMGRKMGDAKKAESLSTAPVPPAYI